MKRKSFSRRRKLPAKVKILNCKIDEAVYEQLTRIAGPESFNVTVEELVKREYRRRERRLSQPEGEKTLNTPQVVPE